ncbi:putative Transcription factor domain-containing protein [Seiridium cardinale]|uniref:Transcription factor domain-containing protein n=1 Tax=Seiridium cardinale TaxID=138064 RepID=A0ABR2Y9L0_9PEZI
MNRQHDKSGQRGSSTTNHELPATPVARSFVTVSSTSGELRLTEGSAQVGRTPTGVDQVDHVDPAAPNEAYEVAFGIDHAPMESEIVDNRSTDDAIIQTSLIIPHDALCEPHGGCYLPPPEEGRLLLQEFIVDFNQATPLFDPKQILVHFQMCYLGKADGVPLPWVVTYVVLGIAHRLRAMSLSGTPEDDSQAGYYLSNSLTPLASLLMQEPSLFLIQCLLSVAAFLKMWPPPQPVALFVSTALRLAQTLGLQENCTPETPMQHSRVFWLAFIMEMTVCFPAERLPGQALRDIGIKAPRLSRDDKLGSITATNGAWTANLLTLRIHLSLIYQDGRRL